MKRFPQKNENKEYPDCAFNTHEMNKILRHKLRNFCAGMQMTVDAMSRKSSDTYVLGKLPLISNELADILLLTCRMDLLFSPLPETQESYLYDIMENIYSYFSETFPQCSLDIEGLEYDVKLEQGNWFEIILRELLANAAEAAGRGNSVKLLWQIEKQLSVIIVNSGKTWPENIPHSPPVPFMTNKGKHDGMGTSIVQRLCNAMDANIEIKTDLEDLTAVKISNIKYCN